MIQEFLEFANEVKELDNTCKELRHTNHMLRVKINGLKLKLKENGIETDDTDIPSMWSRPLEDYISQVKYAREHCGFSHDTWIWNCLSQLEDDLTALQKEGVS